MADDETWIRPRARAWGNAAQRAVLHAIAEDVARRSGHKVAAVEALRSDGFLEFVAIAGDAEAHAQMVGRASPLSLEHITGLGIEIDGWVHIPGERLDEGARAWLAAYGHRPDVPASSIPHGWHPDDQLVRLLRNEDGELRGILYLDEPVSGLRPTPESLAAVNGEVSVMFEAIVSIVERELFGEQVRMLSQARAAMRSVPPGLGVADFLSEMADAMVAAMAVDHVEVLLAGEPAPSLEPHTAFLEDQMHQVWLRRGHLVVEPDQTWGVTHTGVDTPPVMADFMKERGVQSLLVVPIGMGEDYVGSMCLGRAAGGSRWIDSEINAAVAVAADVAGVALDARLRERERELNAELRGINDYRRDMVTTLAHELRNPVSVLWTQLELIAMDHGTAPISDSLEAMERSARRIEDMIEDLMALASVSDPDRRTPLVPVDLSALVRECAEFLAPVAARTEQQLALSVVDEVVVDGEESGLQRMVTNLLSNAFKYTPPGGRVLLSLAPASDAGRAGARLTCVDTGIGIDASEIGDVFTPFFRSASREARLRPGTGLGLAISERVVKAHHGTVGVESQPGVGTTFTVWLPLAAPVDVR